MRGELVVIDLETTGLDPDHDAIIEVGAVRMKDGQILDEFSRLIDPGFPIPPNITHLTGIRQEDVIGKPDIKAVVAAIRAFIGNAVIVGHNVTFDARFLARQGLVETNLRVDTYDLASVLIPRAPRYNLNSLTAQLGIEIGHAHRALDDAKATALLYWKLWDKVMALPYATLHEICMAARGLPWDAAPVFEAALKEREAEAEDTPLDLTDAFEPWDDEDRPLRPDDNPKLLDSEAVTTLLDEGGALVQSIPGFEKRSQQIAMTRAVVDALNSSQHVMIEAGTGTGKSLAYLIPAILWSRLNNERVVISTNTINLQEQLVEKDIPILKAALKTPFNAAVLKGRGNYLCPRRLAATRRRRPTSIDELRTLAKILVWLLESSTGDRGEISLRGPVENITWQRLSAEDEGCTMERCRAMMDGACPFYKARKQAECSHILIVNHALLLSDATMENRVLPEYRYLVLDEAHHLEDAVTSSLSFRLDESTFRRRLADLGGPQKGLLGDLLRSAQDSLPDKEVAKLERYIRSISEAATLMEHHIGALFKAVRAFVLDSGNVQASDYLSQIRITPDLRERPSFSQIEVIWQTLQEFIDVISQAMLHLTDALGRLETYDMPDYNDIFNSTVTAARFLQDMNKQLTAFILEPTDNSIYWISAGQDMSYNLSINAAPLHVGTMVERYLWDNKESVIMTSATLRTNGSFNYLRERLNGQHVDALEVGSPFNYHESTLIYIPNDIPEPTNRYQYQQAVERGLIELAAALNGRVLGLFTSYTHLRQTAQAIAPRLALGDITVYDQSDGSSRQALLEGFKSTERAVLLGTRSFWEGVDIPGDSLSALVIVRLPFAVPSDPIFAARSETYENSFNEYAIPDAILRFRQGFGRLIRTSTDRGVVAIFDRRIISKGYGSSFLEALPDCTVQKGTLDMLPTAAKKWLNQT